MLSPIITNKDEVQRNPMNNQTSITPKTKQFQNELDELLKKYQYQLVPKIKSTDNGILPWIAIFDVVPPKNSNVKDLKKENIKIAKPTK